MGTGVLGDEIDLNDIDTSGMYRVQKPKNGPYDYGQLLVIHGYGDTIAQVCFDYAANRCAVRCARGLDGASPKWEDWTAIALCAAPEVHELPLVDNITSNNIVYYKSQEGIVTIVGSVAGDFPASQSTVIGNVPEGFRPAYMIEVPAAFTMGATGKRLKDCGELSGQNDADVLTEPGFYRGGDTSKMLLHAPIISFAWTLEVLANSAWNVGVTQRFIDFETRRMFIRSNHPLEGGWVWYDWVEVAQCVVPEVHNLPLANGWLTYGTSINWYSKDQFGQVTIYFRLKSTVTTITDSITIANIPEGFRPQHGMSIPGLLTFDNYTKLPCHVDIVPSGALQLYVDGTAPSGRSVIELTCAEFHYPAK